MPTYTDSFPFVGKFEKNIHLQVTIPDVHPVQISSAQTTYRYIN